MKITKRAVLTAQDASPSALYQRVKQHIAERVAAGEWRPGERIPSEPVLVQQLGVSRMTINRALRELATQGRLIRIGGVGTFVAEPRPQTALVQIGDIAAEIQERGHVHECRVTVHAREPSPMEIAATLDLHTGDSVYHTTCLHTEDGTPVQLEDRYVSPRAAPRYIEQTFATVTPSKWLVDNVPLNELEHVVEAVMPDAPEAIMLQISREEPCLVMTRRTWSSSMPVTFVRLVHPARRFRLGSRYLVRNENVAA